MKSYVQFTLLFVVMALMSLSIYADDDNYAYAPYAALYNVALKINENIGNLDTLYVQIKARSKLCDIAPNGIKLNIKPSDGKNITVPLDGDARGIFPLYNSLADSNARVVSNQPKATLSLSVTLGINIPKNIDLPYDKLMQPLSDFNNVLKKQAGFFSWLAPTAQGLVLIYYGTAATATIAGSHGLIEYTAEDAGGYHNLPVGVKIIKLTYDKKLDNENPTVHISSEPDAVDPLFSESVEQKISKSTKKCQPSNVIEHGTSGG